MHPRQLLAADLAVAPLYTLVAGGPASGRLVLSRRTLFAAIVHSSARLLCPVATSRAFAAVGARLGVVVGRDVGVAVRVELSFCAGRAGLVLVEAVAGKAVESGIDFATASEEGGLVDVDLSTAGDVDVLLSRRCVASEGAVHDLDCGRGS